MTKALIVHSRQYKISMKNGDSFIVKDEWGDKFKLAQKTKNSVINYLDNQIDGVAIASIMSITDTGMNRCQERMAKYEEESSMLKVKWNLVQNWIKKNQGKFDGIIEHETIKLEKEGRLKGSTLTIIANSKARSVVYNQTIKFKKS